jgi:hypothetical protein
VKRTSLSSGERSTHKNRSHRLIGASIVIGTLREEAPMAVGQGCPTLSQTGCPRHAERRSPETLLNSQARAVHSTVFFGKQRLFRPGTREPPCPPWL